MLFLQGKVVEREQLEKQRGSLGAWFHGSSRFHLTFVISIRFVGLYLLLAYEAGRSRLNSQRHYCPV